MTLVLGGDAADDADVGNLVSRIDLVGPDAARIRLQVHADDEVAGDGDHGDAIAGWVDGYRHDRVGQIWSVVLITAPTDQGYVDLLAVLQLVRDRARRRLDRLHDLADRIDIAPCRLG